LSAKRRKSAKQKIKDFLLEHIGEVVTKNQLSAAAAPATEWARRLREVRREEGWPIVSDKDDANLRPGEYMLTKEPPPPGEYRFAKPISARLRSEVLERNGYTCQMCGAGVDDVDAIDPNRTVRLHIGHIVDRAHGGEDRLDNLRVMCAACNQGAKHLVQEPPSWKWLMGQVRRARRDDQREVLRWLRNKFRDDDGP